MTETGQGTKDRSPLPPKTPAKTDANGKPEPTSPQKDGQPYVEESVSRAGPDQLEQDLDRLSLQRALIDFDVANARVIDLTHRYVEATEEVKRLRHELETLRLEHANTLADLEQTRGTKAYQIAQRIWALRRALNV